MKKLLVVFALLGACTCLNAQTVLLSQDVLKDTIVPQRGPNRKNFTHLYAGYGVITGDAKGFNISNDFRAGIRYKRKLSKVLSLGFDVQYDRNSFRFAADTISKNKLNLNKVEGGIYFRINYGRRGDKVGNFVDLGGSGGYIFKSAFLQTMNNPSPESKKQVIKHTGIRGANELAYSLIARIGFGRVVLYGDYRISDVMKSGSTFPNVTAGIQIGMH